MVGMGVCVCVCVSNPCSSTVACLSPHAQVLPESLGGTAALIPVQEALQRLAPEELAA